MSSRIKKGLALLLSMLMTAGAAGTCRTSLAEPALAGDFQGHQYAIITESLSWRDAEAACEEEGGYLAVITTQEESDYIMGLIPNHYPKLWIGGTDEAEEGSWHWVTGEAFSFTAWAVGEPNDHEGEDYLQIDVTRLWNDGSDREFCYYLRESGDEPEAQAQEEEQAQEDPQEQGEALPAGEEDKAPGYRLLRVGMRGEDVARLKERMKELNYINVIVAENLYSRLFSRFIREFQRRNRLVPTGVATPALQRLIFSDQAVPRPGE